MADDFVRHAAGDQEDVPRLYRDRNIVEMEGDGARDGAPNFRLVMRVPVPFEPRVHRLKIVHRISEPFHFLGNGFRRGLFFPSPFSKFHPV